VEKDTFREKNLAKHAAVKFPNESPSSTTTPLELLVFEETES
jgi:hypothetical protein